MNQQKNFITRSGRALALIAGVLIAALLINSLTLAQPDSPEATLRRAVQRAADSGSYAVTIDLVQTIYAAPINRRRERRSRPRTSRWKATFIPQSARASR